MSPTPVPVISSWMVAIVATAGRAGDVAGVESWVWLAAVAHPLTATTATTAVVTAGIDRRRGNPSTSTTVRTRFRVDVTKLVAIPRLAIRGQRWARRTAGPDGRNRPVILVCMRTFNYQISDWVSQPSDCVLDISALGVLLGTLTDVAEVIRLSGHDLAPRPATATEVFPPVTYDEVLSLQRYIPQHMVLMGRNTEQQWAELQVPANSIVMHSEWLTDAEHIYRTAAHNLVSVPDLPVPVIHDSAQEFADALTNIADMAANLYDGITSVDDDPEAVSTL